MPARWKTVQCVENHDVVYVGKELRISRLADPFDPWSWYGRSRASLSLGLLMTAPGIAQLFMARSFSRTPWSGEPNAALHIYWDGLSLGKKPMVDFLRCSQELIRLFEPCRHCAAFHRPDLDRVLASHRWIQGQGGDVVVVATPAEFSLYGHRIGFPRGGVWIEVFDSDGFDEWVNPRTAGNGGSIFAAGDP